MITTYAKIRAVSTKLAIAANTKTREAIALAQAFEPTAEQEAFRTLVERYPATQRPGLIELTKFLKPELIPNAQAEGYITKGIAKVDVPVFGVIAIKRIGGVIADAWLNIGDGRYLKLANKANGGGHSTTMNVEAKEFAYSSDEEITSAMAKVYLTKEFQRFLESYLSTNELDMDGNAQE